MAVITTTPVTKVIEYTDITDPENPIERKGEASFNGKIYNGKRYINVRMSGSKTTITVTWKDGFGWDDKRDGRRIWADLVIEAFGLE